MKDIWWQKRASSHRKLTSSLKWTVSWLTVKSSGHEHKFFTWFETLFFTTHWNLLTRKTWFYVSKCHFLCCWYVAGDTSWLVVTVFLVNVVFFCFSCFLLAEKLLLLFWGVVFLSSYCTCVFIVNEINDGLWVYICYCCPSTYFTLASQLAQDTYLPFHVNRHLKHKSADTS